MNLKPSILTAFVVCSSLFYSSAFAQNIIPVDTSHVKTLRIDPSNANGGTVTDFFSEVEYIPLETNKESLFGSIGRLEMTDDRYIILDNEERYILIFDKKGKFIKKIGSANDYIRQFALNKWTKQFVFADEDGKEYHYYDQDGKLLKNVPTDARKNKDKINFQFYFLSKDKGFAEYHTYKEKDTTSQYYKHFQGSLILFANDDRKVYAKGMQFPEAQTGLDLTYMGRNAFLTPGTADSVFYYSRLYDYAIYTVSPNKIELTYKFMFPLDMSIPANFSMDTTMRGKRYEWFNANQDKIQNVTNFYRTGNNLMFSVRSVNSNDEDLLIYNLKSGAVVGYKHISQDQSNSFLPIFEGRTDHHNGGIITSSNNCLYSQISSLEMFKHYEMNKDKQVKYTPQLNQYFTTRDRKDNPVILRLKLKDEI